MATIKQVQDGFIKFVDKHLSGAFEGWQRAVVVGASTLLAAGFPNLVKVYAANPVVAAMGVYNPQAGTIDIDALYNAFIPNLGNDKIPVSIPKIGTIKLSKDDIDVLVRYIKEA